MHYALVALHVRIQTAAAYERLGKRGEARDAAGAGACRRRAGRHRDAVCGELPLSASRCLPQDTQTALTARVLALGEAGGAAAERDGPAPQAFAALTEREYALVGLMAQRLTQPGDRGKAVSLRGKRQAICKPDLFQAPHRGRPAHEAQAARGAAHAKGMTWEDVRRDAIPSFIGRSWG